MQFEVMRPDVIRSVRHRWLVQYWGYLGGTDRLPCWRRVDMTEMARVMDGAVTFTVAGNGGAPRYMIEYQGPRLTEAYGMDCTGKYLDEVQQPHLREFTLAIYDKVVASLRPVYSIAETQDVAGRRVDHERLIVPFGRRGEEVNRLLAVIETICPDGGFENGLLLSATRKMNYRVVATIEAEMV